MGHDAIALKSGWDEYGIAYGKPTTNIHIRVVHLQSSSGSGLAIGSEMSGGISNVLAEHLYVYNSLSGIKLKTTAGRGGYIKDILISDTEIDNVQLAIGAVGDCGRHPDDKYDSTAIPAVKNIGFKNVVGRNVGFAGNFTGIYQWPFTSICLSNVTFSITSKSYASWFCSYVIGSSERVSPEPCSNLQSSFVNASFCFSILHPSSGGTAIL